MPQNQFPEINIDQLYKLLEEQKDEICKQHKDEICDRCRNEWFPDNTPGPCPKKPLPRCARNILQPIPL